MYIYMSMVRIMGDDICIYMTDIAYIFVPLRFLLPVSFVHIYIEVVFYI